MNFEIHHDWYYSTMPDELSRFIPEFCSLFERNEVYMMLGQFCNFIIDNIDNLPLFNKCITFINQSLAKGGGETEDAFVVQVFESVYTNASLINMFQGALNGKALIIFNQYLDK